MSKFFFKGRRDVMLSHAKSGYNTKRAVKAGTEQAPIAVIVASDERKAELEAIAAEHDLVITVTVDASQEENTVELDGALNKPKTQVFEKTPNRNEPCSCGSGKKYKKCCG
uniref:PBPRA1643 family SWIM/SEC-C metal-binding motif protein n=1 Tax=Thaumasiovibrio occultus TaxID=1891184 RepID=UPI000B361898|nr:PBPRA1643 family SWIM/SEC-C metal-binding motif protein [Thaumasiovibrio occultus]